MSTHHPGTALDQLYRHVTVPLARRLARVPGVTPNRVSLAAFAAGGVAAPLLVAGRRLRAAGAVFALSDLLDYLDGDVARAQGTASAQGDILDGILDRYTDFFCISALSLFAGGVLGGEEHPRGAAAARAGQDGHTALLVGFAAMIGCLLPSYVQALAVANGQRTVQSVGGRGTRNRIIFLGLLARRPFWSLTAIALLSNATTVHRAVHLLRASGEQPPPVAAPDAGDGRD